MHRDVDWVGSLRKSTRRRRKGRIGEAARRLLVESLEQRRVLSAVPVVDLSHLEVDSDSYDSNLLVRYRSTADAPIESESLFGPSRIAAQRPIGFGLQKIELKPGVAVESMLESYRRNADVLYAEPDYRLRVTGVPDDPMFDSQWDMHNTGQTGGTADADIDAPEAWDVTTGNRSTVVAVIDTGVDYLHPDLAANIWTNPGEIDGDGIDNDGNGYVDDYHGYDFFNDDPDPMDDHNHGTHVAGTIGAVGNDGVGIAGINWDVQIMAVKFLGADGSGTTSAAIEAVQYAVDNGAHISNNSWGGDPFSQSLLDVIAYAQANDHIFVAAAGNGNIFGLGVNNDTTPFYPASYNLSNVVSVAATDHADAKAVFSNYGAQSVDIGAPGVDIVSTVPGGYASSSGTSMAAPHVTGALSLVRDYNPGMSTQEIIDTILLSADPIDSLAGITVTGARLNLANALIPDTQGPSVANVQPSGLVLDPFSSIRVTFSESIETSSFTLADIESLSGPQGAITVNSLAVVAGSNGRQFDLSIGSQSAIGDYELVINPNLEDRFGNVMDQNGNGTGGEVPGDVFSHQWQIADTVGRFDFGTATTAVAPNYTQVIHSDDYDAATGYGWIAGNVYSLGRGSHPLTGDVNYTIDATFAVDMPNGQYDVIVTLGEDIIGHDQMGVFLEGVQVDSVDTAGDEHAVNTYRTTVSDGQLSLGLTDLGGSDSYVMINALDIVFAGPDVDGPQVIATTPTDTVEGEIDSITLVFGEAIDETSFTLDDIVVLEGPEGALTPLTLSAVSTNEFAITFEAQTTPGQYRLVVGPDIHDVGGNPMDQDGDGTSGELIDDQFELLVTLEPGPIIVGKFDFGTTLSLVAEGYTPIAKNAYSPAVGYGWQGGPVYSIDRGGDALSRDNNYTMDATFAVDLPNGEYDAIVTMGEPLLGHDLMGVFVEGVQVDTVTTAGGQFAINTYRASVSDGQLNLRLDDLGGTNSWAVINGLEIHFVGPDLTGPSVIATNASGAIEGPLDQITLTFSEGIDPATFTLDDVVSLSGPGGPIVPLAVNSLGSGDFAITFESQNTSGDYELTIGPDISDLAGNLMDQDGDGNLGESSDDQFASQFTLEAGPLVVARFDFGTTSSPVATDYTQVAKDAYSPATGYGWHNGTVYSINRGGDPLTRDTNYTHDAEFVVDLPNGEYDVTVTMGELLLSHDLMGVYVEGVQVDSVTTAGNEFAVNTYRTSITDGQLSLRLEDQGGTNTWAVINGLEVAFVGPDLTGPSVTSSDAVGTVNGPIDQLAVTFSEPIDSDSFTIADVVVLSGPGGAITPTDIIQVAPGDFLITFASQNIPGDYQLVIGPQITDVAGNLMDQDVDGILGETPDDQFDTAFTLQTGPTVIGRFDFGTYSSPVAEGYTQVVKDAYDAVNGYGWQNGTVYSINRGGDAMKRDTNYTHDAEFVIDVPNGQYDVTLTMGEALIGHDQMGVYFEGVQFDTVTSAAFQYVVNTYQVTVTDGQLSFRLVDLGGSNSWAIINGMEVVTA